MEHKGGIKIKALATKERKDGRAKGERDADRLAEQFVLSL